MDTATSAYASLGSMPDTILLQARDPAPARRHRHHRRGTRTSRMYILIVVAWVLLCIPMIRASQPIITEGFRRNTAIGVTLIFDMLFVAYFWLNGWKDVIYPLAYRLTTWREQAPPPRASRKTPSVALLYVTCNDFSEESLSASIRQEYPNYQVAILDDSSKPEYIEQVADYGYLRRIPVIRRPNRQGFKAGNLNNYLRSPEGRKFDYFVIVDSDEILPPYFVTRCLDYFARDQAVGIVQANHIATRNRTSFMRMFAPGVDSHFPAYQLVKAHAGFLSLLGHGAMVSRECYQAAGGFPEIVAEDIGFAIDALSAGYRCDFAADITCEEEFPPDFLAFKKRHRRWTGGNMEFMRKYTRMILFGRGLKWYERLDIILFAYGLPLAGVFSIYVAVNAILFPLIKFHYQYPLWMLVPTVICLIAPMLNDVLAWRKAPKNRLTAYLLHSMMLFGSMFFVSWAASVRTMFTGSHFHVTPKKSGRVGLKTAFKANAPQIIAAILLAAAVEIVAGSVLPVILLVIPVIFMVYMTVMNASDTENTIDRYQGKHILKNKEK